MFLERPATAYKVFFLAILCCLHNMYFPGWKTMFCNSRSLESNKGIIHGGKDLVNLNSSCEFIKDFLKSVTFGKQ